MGKKKSRTRPEQLSKEEVIKFLSEVDDRDFLNVFQVLFENRRPQMEPETFSRDRYFLGVASRSLESEEDGSEYWGPWSTQAVGYANMDFYADGMPSDGFEQSGPCTRCRTEVRAHTKHTVCPVCGAKLYLT